MLERLGQVVVAAGFEAGDDILGVGLGGHQDDRDEPVRRVLLEPLHDLDAVELRHHDVEQDQIGLELGRARERLLAVSRGDDLIALRFEPDAQDIQVGRDVVDGQNAWRISQPPALSALSARKSRTIARIWRGLKGFAI